jgi:ribosome-interacting GTPase 1
MSTTVEKIKQIEDEMSKTQKNKATSYHLGQLKAKLAKLRKELVAPPSGGGGGAGVGFDVARTGVASVYVIPPLMSIPTDNVIADLLVSRRSERVLF